MEEADDVAISLNATDVDGVGRRRHSVTVGSYGVLVKQIMNCMFLYPVLCSLLADERGCAGCLVAGWA